MAPSRRARATGSGSPTEPSIHSWSSIRTGGPASSGIDAVARIACFHSAPLANPVSECGLRSPARVTSTCSGTGLWASDCHSVGLEWTRMSSSRWSSETTGRRLPNRRGSMNSREAMSSEKMRAASAPWPSTSAVPTNAPADAP